MRHLSGQDATFIFMEDAAAPLHLTSLYIYDPGTAANGKVTHKQLLAHIRSRLHISRVFTQKLHHVPLDLDFPYWVDDPDFDLEFHVRHIALPSPQDWRQLCILVARLHSHPLDMSRPPWEMYIIEGLNNVEGVPPGSFAVLSKYHHAAIDGATGIEIISGLHDLTARPPAENTPVQTLQVKEIRRRAAGATEINLVDKNRHRRVSCGGIIRVTDAAQVDLRFGDIERGEVEVGSLQCDIVQARDLRIIYLSSAEYRHRHGNVLHAFRPALGGNNHLLQRPRLHMLWAHQQQGVGGNY